MKRTFIVIMTVLVTIAFIETIVALLFIMDLASSTALPIKSDKNTEANFTFDKENASADELLLENSTFKTGNDVQTNYIAVNPLVAWINRSRVNLRSEPSLGATVLAILSDKQEIMLLDSKDDWGFVKVGDKEGYVYLKYISTNIDVENSVISKNNSAGEQSAAYDSVSNVWIRAANVNLYNEPLQNSSVIDVLIYGQEIELIDIVDEWALVSVNNVKGYVLSVFISSNKIEQDLPSPQMEPHIYNQSADSFTIAIDPGHQAKGNYDYEPIGPDASESKPKVASGTQGIVTKVPEYKLTLEVSLKLRDVLLVRGYNVIMIRETNDVNISNKERAIMAADAGADILVRIHADGSENSNVNGILTLCPTKNNRFIPNLYEQSHELSNTILSEMVSATGTKNRGVSEVDNMSGINWSTIPVTIVEMGLMTNPTEDKLMQTDEYQQKLVTGIADGIAQYFTEYSNDLN